MTVAAVPRPAILYVSYDGMLEPLGQSQVLSYLEQLAGEFEIYLISFEKKTDMADRALRQGVEQRIRAAGINWKPLRYHKSPSAPATAYDVLIGTLAALWTAVRRRVRVVHARSYVPAVIGLSVKRLTGAKLLFDMRGLWADERVDAGLWPAGGRLYRITKSLERRLLLAADQVVTLTEASAREISGFPYMRDARAPMTVIPTCANLDRFRRVDQGQRDGLTYGFVGAASTWSLFSEVLRSFSFLLDREPTARLLVINRGEHEYIRRLLAGSGIDEARVELLAANHTEMPALVSRMDIAAALRKPTYSQVACAPTKLAEYLGCGVPCLVNTGIGDVAELVRRESVGSVTEDFSETSMRAALDRLLELARDPGTQGRCVAAARRHFSLERGVSAYRKIYHQITAPGPDRARAQSLLSETHER